MSSLSAADLRRIARLSAREGHLIAASEFGGDVMPVGGDKVRGLLDAAAALEALGAGYALIGGVAVGLHSGVPRATLDTDLAVETRARGRELIAAFEAAGFDLRGEYRHSLNFRHASGEPVQLAFDAWFDPMIARAASFDVDGATIRVVTRDDLLAMKRRAAAAPDRRESKSLRDRADVALLLGDVPDLDEGW